MTQLLNPAALQSRETQFGQYYQSEAYGTCTDLFSPEHLARCTDPDTSKAAAARLDPTKLENEVLNAIKSFGSFGCISDQVEAKLSHIKISSLTPRYAGLVKKGLIQDSGQRRTALSKRQQIVWVATW
tara:strand:+ start:862 stop:1245 length:384 start_codon:yes stop_codon:yes gene_type:complete